MPDIKNDESLPMERYPTPIVGRLIAMPTTGSTSTLSNIVGLRTGVVAFDFPAMPDAIDLARSADYYVNFTPVTPDGIHQYRGTRPLEIPFSFKLHAMDKNYCPYGALTLLQLAARLHSFVLPISTETNVGAEPVLASAASAVSTDAKSNTTAQAVGESTQSKIAYDSTQNAPVYQTVGKKGKVQTYPPVTCLLNLIWVAESQPGISCIGYVKEVKARLLGPWLRGRGGEFNLPSAGEFEFTFVHRPAHSNNYGFSIGSQTNSQYPTATAETEVQAYATDVRNQLFNTRNLVVMANYNGFTADPGANQAVDTKLNQQSQGQPAQQTPTFFNPA